MASKRPVVLFRLPRRNILRFPRKRRDRAILRALRAAFGPASFLSPYASACWAELLFRTPPRFAPLVHEREVLARGRYRAIPFLRGRLATWTFGEGPPVLLVHGWGGHAGRLGRFVEPLVRSGFSVVAFDAPGHGLSSGRRSSLPDFVTAIDFLASEHAAAEHSPLAGIVGHSMGASAAALAIRRGLPVPRAVLLAPPADPEEYARRFSRYFGIPSEVCDGMKRRLEGRYAVSWDDLRIDVPVERAATELLVVHDRGDARVPWKDGLAVARAWPGARLLTTNGLGHHKILRGGAVVSAAVHFLRELPARRRATSPSATAPAG